MLGSDRRGGEASGKTTGMRTSIRRTLRPWIARALRRLYLMGEAYVEEDLPPFANEPKNLRIELPRRLAGTERMHIGNDVAIGPNSFLFAQTYYPTEVMRPPHRPMPVQHFEPSIVIGNRVTATGALTIGAMQRVEIEDDVMFATNVLVSDGLHGFAHAREPYKYQPMWRIAPIVVGRGSWVGQNAVIMPGVTIGELAIIGANSVVTRNVPARSIAVGNPARVVKRWDSVQEAWVPVADGHEATFADSG
jgi:acetyltransferase-like isoleucine patch superfamily enzyme